MKKLIATALLCSASLTGCVTPSHGLRGTSETMPQALTSSPSTGPSLLERFKLIDSEMQDSLRKAQRASPTSMR